MSMHLCGPALTTTSYKKKKDKVTKAKQAELELGWKERNQRLKEMGLPKETFDQYIEWVYGTGKKASKKEINRTENKKAGNGSTNYVSHIDATLLKEKLPSKKSWVTGACSSKPTPTYTGTEMIGITVLHKSCLQPIFSKEAAEDAAKMRR